MAVDFYNMFRQTGMDIGDAMTSPLRAKIQAEELRRSAQLYEQAQEDRTRQLEQAEELRMRRGEAATAFGEEYGSPAGAALLRADYSLGAVGNLEQLKYMKDRDRWKRAKTKKNTELFMDATGAMNKINRQVAKKYEKLATLPKGEERSAMEDQIRLELEYVEDELVPQLRVISNDLMAMGAMDKIDEWTNSVSNMKEASSVEESEALEHLLQESLSKGMGPAQAELVYGKDPGSGVDFSKIQTGQEILGYATQERLSGRLAREEVNQIFQASFGDLKDMADNEEGKYSTSFSRLAGAVRKLMAAGRLAKKYSAGKGMSFPSVLARGIRESRFAKAGEAGRGPSKFGTFGPGMR